MREISFISILDVPESVSNKILDIRNLESIRKLMYSDHVISKNEHSNWLRSLKNNDAQKVWVIFYKDEPIGDVSLSRISNIHLTADWAFSIRPESQGIGLGGSIEYKLVDMAFTVFQLEKLNCEVLASNDKVVKLHQKFGFQIEGVRRSNISKDGVRLDVILLGITKDEWLSFEPNLRRYK